mgnify:CR=1 FL=1
MNRGRCGRTGSASRRPPVSKPTLIRASTPEEALRRTREHLADVGHDYKNPDGVLLRDTVVGLTSLLPIYDDLEDGNEIEWIDRTGETVMEMSDRVRDDSALEAFTVPKGKDQPLPE